MKMVQLELPYPIGPLILEPVLTKEAVERLGLNKFSLTDFALKDCEVDYENCNEAITNEQ